MYNFQKCAISVTGILYLFYLKFNLCRNYLDLGTK